MLQNLPKLVSPVLSLLPQIISQYSSLSNSWFLTCLHSFSIFISCLELKTTSIQWHQTVYTLDILVFLFYSSLLWPMCSLWYPTQFPYYSPKLARLTCVCLSFCRYSLSLNLQNIHVISYYGLLVFAQIISIYWVVPYTTFKILPLPQNMFFSFPDLFFP